MNKIHRLKHAKYVYANLFMADGIYSWPLTSDVHTVLLAAAVAAPALIPSVEAATMHLSQAIFRICTVMKFISAVIIQARSYCILVAD